MPNSVPKSSDRSLVLLSSVSGLLAGLCCLAPIVMVMAGLATVAAANSVGNWLYGDYKWHFRALALVFLALALLVHFRRRGICTLNQARRQRNTIINSTLLVLSIATTVYVFWTYVVLHYWGIAAGLPWAQWDESWAIPASAALAGISLFLIWRRLRSRPVLVPPPATKGEVRASHRA